MFSYIKKKYLIILRKVYYLFFKSKSPINIFKAGDFDKAHNIVLELLKEKKISVIELREILEFYKDRTRPKKTIEFTSNARKFFIKQYPLYELEALSFLLINKKTQAFGVIEEFKKNNPKSKKIFSFQSKILEKTNDIDASIKLYEKLVTKYPNQIYWNLKFLIAKLSKGQFSENQILSFSKDLKRINSKKENYFEKYTKNNLTFKNHILSYSEDSELYNMWVNSFNTSYIYKSRITKSNQVYLPFQYWSQGNPPHDVLKITEKWNRIFKKLGINKISLFDKKSAGAWIDKFCPELSIPFSTAFHYCVEADVFRVAFASKNNSIYLDSDLYPTIHTPNILQRLIKLEKNTTLLFKWHSPWITNSFFLTTSNSKFFNKIVSENIDLDFRKTTKDRDTIMGSFGPRRFNITLNQMISNSEFKDELDDNSNLTFMNTAHSIKTNPPFRLSYLNTNDKWQNVFGRINQ